MNRTARTLGFSIWALLGVPIVFAAYVHLAYRIALSRGDLPFLASAEWRWYAGYSLLLGSGLLAVTLIPFSKRWVGVALGVAYVGIMGILLAGVSLEVSCVNGDCL